MSVQSYAVVDAMKVLNTVTVDLVLVNQSLA